MHVRVFSSNLLKYIFFSKVDNIVVNIFFTKKKNHPQSVMHCCSNFYTTFQYYSYLQKYCSYSIYYFLIQIQKIDQCELGTRDRFGSTSSGHMAHWIGSNGSTSSGCTDPHVLGFRSTWVTLFTNVKLLPLFLQR